MKHENEYQRMGSDACLCAAHREAFQAPRALSAPEPISDDEPIVCDACTMYALRSAGVI